MRHWRVTPTAPQAFLAADTASQAFQVADTASQAFHEPNFMPFVDGMVVEDYAVLLRIGQFPQQPLHKSQILEVIAKPLETSQTNEAVTEK